MHGPYGSSVRLRPTWQALSQGSGPASHFAPQPSAARISRPSRQDRDCVSDRDCPSSEWNPPGACRHSSVTLTSVLTWPTDPVMSGKRWYQRYAPTSALAVVLANPRHRPEQTCVFISLSGIPDLTGDLIKARLSVHKLARRQIERGDHGLRQSGGGGLCPGSFPI